MELTPQEWDRVDAIARALAKDVDRNELGKVVTFFRLHRDKGKFLTLIERLSRSEEYIRSQRTRGYFQRILRTCQQHLNNVDDERALQMVSWALRLMTYYEAKTGEPPSHQFQRG
jgi:hypothetical protein